MISKENWTDRINKSWFYLCGWCGVICILVLLLQPVVVAASPRVFVTNYPLKYFAERIGGESIEVVLPVPANMDPYIWRPGRDTILAMQKADLILLNGAGYEQWLTMVSLPRSRLYNTSSSLKDKFLRAPSQSTHSHGPGGEHSHEVVRHTIWLDYQLAAEQARSVGKALTKLTPRLQEDYAANTRLLVSDLQDLDDKFTALFAKVGDQPILASQPVYDYFARRYALNIHSLLWLPQTMASPKQWHALERLLGKFSAKLMLWREAPIGAMEKRLHKAGVASVVFNPCGNVPEKGDFLSVMHENYETVRRVFP